MHCVMNALSCGRQLLSLMFINWLIWESVGWFISCVSLTELRDTQLVKHYFWVCLWGCFWKRSVSESEDWAKRFACVMWADLIQSLGGLNRTKWQRKGEYPLCSVYNFLFLSRKSTCYRPWILDVLVHRASYPWSSGLWPQTLLYH